MIIELEDLKWLIAVLVIPLIGSLWKHLNDKIQAIDVKITQVEAKGVVMSNDMESEISDIRESIAKHREHVLAFYPTRDETRAQFQELRAVQEKTNDKLDRIIQQLADKEDRRK